MSSKSDKMIEALGKTLAMVLEGDPPSWDPNKLLEKIAEGHMELVVHYLAKVSTSLVLVNGKGEIQVKATLDKNQRKGLVAHLRLPESRRREYQVGDRFGRNKIADLHELAKGVCDDLYSPFGRMIVEGSHWDRVADAKLLPVAVYARAYNDDIFAMSEDDLLDKLLGKTLVDLAKDHRFENVVSRYRNHKKRNHTDYLSILGVIANGEGDLAAKLRGSFR